LREQTASILKVEEKPSIENIKSHLTDVRGTEIHTAVTSETAQ
jgi:hypothetical protein